MFFINALYIILVYFCYLMSLGHRDHFVALFLYFRAH